MSERVCLTEGCTADTARGGAFCTRCSRLIREEEWWAMRMAYASPCFSPMGSGKLNGVIEFWGGSINGGERMWIFDHEVPPNGQAVSGITRIAEILGSVEWWLVAEAVASRLHTELRWRAYKAEERLRQREWRDRQKRAS